MSRDIPVYVRARSRTVREEEPEHNFTGNSLEYPISVMLRHKK